MAHDVSKLPRKEQHVIERDQERRRAALEAWLKSHRDSNGVLPFDRLLVDIAFTAGWCAKRSDKAKR